MEANELRVGNLVSRDGLVYEANFITITLAHKYEPIPLTGKWLLKFGFKKYFDNNNESYFRINDDMFITADYYVYLMGDDAFECLKLKRKIKYIHQLQNLYFAITGEELTIKI